MSPKDNFVRSARYLRTIDGDTFVAEVDLVPPAVHPQVRLEINVRTRGWSAAELREPEGPAMRVEFERLLRSAKLIDLELRNMSFNRCVCSVYLDGVLFAGLLERKLMELRHV
jgi:hypothetical protein